MTFTWHLYDIYVAFFNRLVTSHYPQVAATRIKSGNGFFIFDLTISPSKWRIFSTPFDILFLDFKN